VGTISIPSTSSPEDVVASVRFNGRVADAIMVMARDEATVMIAYVKRIFG